MRGGFVTRLTEEHHPDLATHVEGGKEPGNRQQPVYNWEMQTCIEKDFVLRPKPRKRDNACQRQRTDHIQPERDRHGLAKPAHVTHVAGVERFDCASAFASAPLSASFIFFGFSS